MNQKKARKQRKTVTEKPKAEVSKDPRQPLKLDPVTAEDGVRLLVTTLNRALESPEMQVVMRNILKGRHMVLNAIGKPEPDLPWGWQLKGFNVGELWLVPTRREDLGEESAPDLKDDPALSSSHAEPPKEPEKAAAKDSA